MVGQGAFDVIAAFFHSLPDDVRIDAVTAMRTEVASMRHGTFRPCVGPHEIEELYEYQGGPVFGHAWAGTPDLAQAFPDWVPAQHPHTFEQWATRWPAQQRTAYPDAALRDLESLVKDQCGASPLPRFHGSLPFDLAITATQALATFRRHHGG